VWACTNITSASPNHPILTVFLIAIRSFPARTWAAHTPNTAAGILSGLSTMLASSSALVLGRE